MADLSNFATGDVMSWCPCCGQYYYASTGHECKPRNLHPPTWNPDSDESFMSRLERIEKLLKELLERKDQT